MAGAVYRVFLPDFPNSRWLNAAMKAPGLLADCGRARRSADVAVMLAGAAASRPRLRPALLATSIVFALNLYLTVGLGRGFPLPPRNLTLSDSTVLLAAANCALLVWHARRFSAECSASAAAGGVPATA